MHGCWLGGRFVARSFVGRPWRFADSTLPIEWRWITIDTGFFFPGDRFPSFEFFTSTESEKRMRMDREWNFHFRFVVVCFLHFDWTR